MINPNHANLDSPPPALLGATVPRWAAVWLVVLIMVTIAARVGDATPWLGSDDASYHSAAEFLLEGKTIERVHHQYARLAIVIPVALSMSVLGNNVSAVVLPTLILSVCCVLLAVLLGRIIWGWWEGLFAGTVVSLLPFYRVLSTTAYPEVHVCFWSTLAVVLAVAASRSTQQRRTLVLGILCGIALGIAVSAKVFAVLGIVGIAAVIWTQRSGTVAQRAAPIVPVIMGGILFFLFHGLLCWWVADDFWFKLHALQTAETANGLFPRSDDPAAVGVATFIRQRMALFFSTATSGWGILAVMFWPAAMIVLLFNRRGRGIAIWAIAGYLLLAFMPVSFRNGPRPYPSFVGRNVLMVCVPFALCFALIVRVVWQRIAGERLLQQTWPAALGIVAAVAYVNPNELDWFRDRHTSRIAAGISYCIDNTQWDAERNIYMTPSMYWRFRVLFPAALRDRLRVAADPDASDWWRFTTTDIVDRHARLSGPEKAYLLATPKQLAGDTEVWDYFVPLPGAALTAWRRSPTIQYVDLPNRQLVVPVAPTADNAKWRLLLLGGDAIVTDRNRKKNHDSTVG